MSKLVKSENSLQDINVNQMIKLSERVSEALEPKFFIVASADPWWSRVWILMDYVFWGIGVWGS